MTNSDDTVFSNHPNCLTKKELFSLVFTVVSRIKGYSDTEAISRGISTAELFLSELNLKKETDTQKNSNKEE